MSVILEPGESLNSVFTRSDPSHCVPVRFVYIPTLSSSIPHIPFFPFPHLSISFSLPRCTVLVDDDDDVCHRHTKQRSASSPGLACIDPLKILKSASASPRNQATTASRSNVTDTRGHALAVVDIVLSPLVMCPAHVPGAYSSSFMGIGGCFWASHACASTPSSLCYESAPFDAELIRISLRRRSPRWSYRFMFSVE
ncbi:hypothetical protein DFP72DRAFT_1091574 [Ephemerocybe angulata]|uniref:Uncharacterized protein n=1 Tax=Ephemerocybe angulata TaxID=980116 RepID=A0A8H6HE03_9AGAR|nr:hypothetical protein DFP72DRAFT_1091574 [Tulosesus angulatus]